MSSFYTDHSLNPEKFDIIKQVYSDLEDFLLTQIKQSGDNTIISRTNTYKTIPIQILDISEIRYTTSQFSVWPSDLTSQVFLLDSKSLYQDFNYNNDISLDIITIDVYTVSGTKLILNLDYTFIKNKFYLLPRNGSTIFDQSLMLKNIVVNINITEKLLQQFMPIPYTKYFSQPLYNHLIKTFIRNAALGAQVNLISDTVSQIDPQSPMIFFDYYTPIDNSKGITKQKKINYWGGTWISGVSYKTGDKRVYNGLYYKSKVDNNTYIPTNTTYWAVTDEEVEWCADAQSNFGIFDAILELSPTFLSETSKSTVIWNGSTSYTAEDQVLYNNYYYISLQNSNLNNIPSATGSTYWKLIQSSVDQRITFLNNFFNLIKPSHTAVTPILTFPVMTDSITISDIKDSISLTGLLSTSDSISLSDILDPALLLGNLTTQDIFDFNSVIGYNYDDSSAYYDYGQLYDQGTASGDRQQLIEDSCIIKAINL